VQNCSNRCILNSRSSDITTIGWIPLTLIRAISHATSCAFAGNSDPQEELWLEILRKTNELSVVQTTSNWI